MDCNVWIVQCVKLGNKEKLDNCLEILIISTANEAKRFVPREERALTKTKCKRSNRREAGGLEYSCVYCLCHVFHLLHKRGECSVLNKGGHRG